METQRTPRCCPVCGQPWLRLGAGLVTCPTRHGILAVQEALRETARAARTATEEERRPARPG